jgi:outer membrane protein insertion porin family
MRRLVFLLVAVLMGFAQAPPTPRRTAPSKDSAAKTAAAPKAPPAAPANKWPIVKLAVEGNRHYTSQQVLALAGLKVGQVAGKEEFDAARDRLVASGFFEMVAYSFEPAPGQDGEIGTFQVTEVEPTYPVRFEALGVPTEELEALLRAKDPLFSIASVPPSKPVLNRYMGWIQELLASKGSEEKVVARVDAAGGDKLAIVFRPARFLPVVAQVTFDGNKAVPQNALRDAISGVAVGVPYTEEHFRELLNTGVRPLYEARGRLRVAFTKIHTEPAKDVQGLHVFVTVEEGDSFQLSKLQIAGSSPLKPEDLLKAGDIPMGEAVNFDRISEGLERMRKALLHAGFMEAKLTTSRAIDDPKKEVAVTVNVDPGPLFLMGKLTIAGLDLDGEAEMQRIWAIKEGKPFNADYPQLFLTSVRERGLFDNLGNTKPEVKINDQDHTVDVTLVFAGAAPQTKQGRGRGRGF